MGRLLLGLCSPGLTPLQFSFSCLLDWHGVGAGTEGWLLLEGSQALKSVSGSVPLSRVAFNTPCLRPRTEDLGIKKGIGLRGEVHYSCSVSDEHLIKVGTHAHEHAHAHAHAHSGQGTRCLEVVLYVAWTASPGQGVRASSATLPPTPGFSSQGETPTPTPSKKDT